MHLLRVVLAIVVLSSCQPQQLDKAKVKEEVVQMFDEYHAAIKREGLKGEFNYLDSSSDFFWVPPGSATAMNYDSVRSILETNASLYQQVEFSWKALEVFPLTNEIANYSGTVRGRMVDKSGVETNVSIIESGTVIKREDGWKLLSGQSAVSPE